MKKYVVCFLLIAVALGSVSAQSHTRVVGYLPTWGNFANFTQTIDYSKYSHINLAFANPNASGILDEQLTDPVLNTFISKAHDEGVQVLISVAGATAPVHWHNLMKAENRTAFIANIMDYLLRYQFDGIDIDLEGNDITADYGNFVTELSVELQKEGLLMTAAVASWNGYQIPDQALSAFDFINLMAYDATGPWNLSNPGQHSSMAFAQQNLNYWHNTRGVPKEKLVLGVPFYGYDFGNNGNALRFSQIVSLQEDAAYIDQIGQLYYNGKPTIAEKTVLGIENYGGIMIWEITQDASGEHSLLDTIYATIMEKEYLIGTGNRLPNVAITAPKNNQTIAQGASVIVHVSAFDTDGDIEYVALILNNDTIKRFYEGDNFMDTLQNLPLGDYNLKALVRDDKGGEKVSTIINFSVKIPTPIIEITLPLPNATVLLGEELDIEAIFTDSVGEINVAAIIVNQDTFAFNEGGNKILAYTSNQYGINTLQFYASNDLGGEILSSPFYFYVNTERKPFNGEPHAIPGTVEAEQYDSGGYNLTYYDVDIENRGGASYRQGDAVDIEMFAPGQYNIGYMDVGEWLEYTVNVAEDANYRVFASTAATTAGGRFELYVDDVRLFATGNLPSSGGWTSFNETNLGEYALEEGEHILRLKVTRKEFNLNYLRFEKAPGVGLYNTDKKLGEIYPIPVVENLYVKSIESGGNFVLFTLSGEKLYSSPINESEIRCDLSFLNPGMYIGQIVQGNSIQSFKIIKQ